MSSSRKPPDDSDDATSDLESDKYESPGPGETSRTDHVRSSRGGEDGLGSQQDEVEVALSFGGESGLGGDGVGAAAEAKKDKGKGRDMSGEASTTAAGSSETKEALGTAGAENVEVLENEASHQRRRTKQLLDGFAPFETDELHRLVALDPTPLERLDLSTKLMKAITLVHSQFVLPVSHDPAPWPSQHGDAGPTGASTSAGAINVQTYSSLMTLLTSALGDVAALPSPRAGQASTQDRKKAEYDLVLARAHLAADSGRATSDLIPWLNYTRPPRPTRPARPKPASAASAPPPMTRQLLHERPVFDEADERDLGDLFSENCRLALLKINSPSLPRPFIHREGSTSISSFRARSNLAKARKCYINTLPPEVLAIIFILARKSSEERHDSTSVYDDRIFDDYGVVTHLHGAMPAAARGGRRLSGMPNELSGSRTAGQSWVHKIALVCRKWRDTSRSVAFRSLHIRKRQQLPKLLATLADPSNSWASHITSINAKVTLPPVDPTVVGSIRGSRSQFRIQQSYGGYAAAGWSGAASSRGKGEEENASVLFTRLVEASPNLMTLALTVAAAPYSAPFGARQSAAEFLEPAMLSTLSRITTLQSLTLGSCIDFEDLEILLHGLPNLEHLVLEASFDDIGGQGTVASPTHHTARLRSLIIGNSYNAREVTNVRDTQLAWLLEPAVESLEHLEVTVLSGAGGGFMGGVVNFAGVAGGGVNGRLMPFPCFASGVFADLLARMGGQLKKLALRDMHTQGGASPSLVNAPHFGNFDYALSECTELEELTIQFQYTGADLLTSLSVAPNLFSLIFLGAPTHTSAADLAEEIESGVNLRSLKQLILSGQFAGRGSTGGFRGSDVRRLKEVTAQRDIYCVLSSG